MRDAPLVNLLIKAGADVDAKSKDGGSPLFWACKKGDEESAHLLLNAGANANAQRSGETALLWSVRKGFVNIAARLLEGGADPNSRGGEFMETCLCWAAEMGNMEMTNVLLQFHADTNLQDDHGDSPLHEAAQQGYFNRKNNCANKNYSSENTIQLSGMLINAGANVDAVNNDGDTALHYAAKRGDTDLAAFLMDRGAKADVLDKDGDTPLHWASQRGDRPMAKLLCERGADVNMLNEAAESPLTSADDRGDVKMTKLLLDYDSPESEDSHFWSESGEPYLGDSDSQFDATTSSDPEVDAIARKELMRKQSTVMSAGQQRVETFVEEQLDDEKTETSTGTKKISLRVPIPCAPNANANSPPGLVSSKSTFEESWFNEMTALADGAAEKKEMATPLPLSSAPAPVSG